MKEVAQKKRTIWIELGTLVIACATLFFVFRHVNLKELGHAFREARVGWLLASIAFYGIAFPPSAWRWHLMLRLTGNVVHLGATFAMTLIGHFFYTLFFGVAGGDFAKSALYARWYQLPLAEILAAAPLDRLLGFGGLLIFALISFALAAANGAFVQLSPGTFHISTGWIVAALVFLVVAWMAFRHFGHRQGPLRWLKALRSSLAQMAASRSIVVQGVFCGFLVQIGLAGSLALALQAVSHTHIPWGPLLWTFPVICIIGAIPLSVAGLGFREGAALGLLGLYGISPADAVAASLLTLVGRLAWAGVGGFVLWKDRRYQLNNAPLPKTISVVIATLNDAENLPEAITRVHAVPEVMEIIVMDEGGRTETRALAERMGCQILQCPPRPGAQWQLGAARATGDIILLLHPNAWLSPNAGKAVLNCFRDVRVAGGGFLRTFRDASPLLTRSQIERAICLFFGRRIFFGDETMFFRREVLTSIAGVPEAPFIEEGELCQRVRKKGRLVLAESTITISAGRFTRGGILRSCLSLRRLKRRNTAGDLPHELGKMYEET